jgi:hypothetical protein
MARCIPRGRVDREANVQAYGNEIDYRKRTGKELTT